MRPAILFPHFADIRTLSGVGPKLEKLIVKVAGPRLADLIFDLPVGVIDRSYRPKLNRIEPGRIATVTVGVLDHIPPRVKSQPYKVRVSDDRALPAHEPVYALTEGLAAKSLARAVRGALEKMPVMPEWQDPAFLKRE